jgi:hypothetical protein
MSPVRVGEYVQVELWALKCPQGAWEVRHTLLEDAGQVQSKKPQHSWGRTGLFKNLQGLLDLAPVRERCCLEPNQDVTVTKELLLPVSLLDGLR